MPAALAGAAFFAGAFFGAEVRGFGAGVGSAAGAGAAGASSSTVSASAMTFARSSADTVVRAGCGPAGLLPFSAKPGDRSTCLRNSARRSLLLTTVNLPSPGTSKVTVPADLRQSATRFR